MRSILITAAIGIVIGHGASAAAQTRSTEALPPVELAVGVDATWLRAGMYLDEGVVAEPMFHVRATQPVTRNLAIEGIFAVSKWFNTGTIGYRTEALYAVQIKQSLWRRPRGDFFATYGVVGSRTRAYTYDTLHPPFYVMAGGGFQQELGSRLALRIEAQGVALAGFAPIGGRLATGLSFPLGRYR